MDTWQNLDPTGWDQRIESWLLMHNFTDTSWHNDNAPSFHNDARDLRVWIDCKAMDQRDGSSPRFELHQYIDGEFTASLGMCERWETMQAAIEGLLGLSTLTPEQILGTPVRHTDLESEHVQDVTGLESADIATAWGDTPPVAALIYHESLYILELSDGQFWTLIGRGDYTGTREELEIHLAEFAKGEGYGST